MIIVIKLEEIIVSTRLILWEKAG